MDAILDIRKRNTEEGMKNGHKTKTNKITMDGLMTSDSGGYLEVKLTVKADPYDIEQLGWIPGGRVKIKLSAGDQPSLDAFEDPAHATDVPVLESTPKVSFEFKLADPADSTDSEDREVDPADEEDPDTLEGPEDADEPPEFKAQNPWIANRCKEFQPIDGVKARSGTIDHACFKCDMFLEEIRKCDNGIPIKQEIKTSPALEIVGPREEPLADPPTDPRESITDDEALRLATEMLQIGTETHLKFSIIASNLDKIHAGKGFTATAFEVMKHLIKEGENVEQWLSDQVAEGRMECEESLGRTIYRIVKPYKFPVQTGYEEPKKNSRRKKA